MSPAFEAMPICYKCNVESIIGPEETLLWRSYTNQPDLAWASLDEDVHPGEFFAVGTVGGGCGLELGHPAHAPAGAGLASYRGAPAMHVREA
jgi:hypothetical protein